MPRVVISPCASYDPHEVRAGLRHALEPLGGMDGFVRRGCRVLLKPNYVMGRGQDRPANTHPEVILAVAELVRECGGEPFVADSPALGSAAGVAARSGLLARANDTGLAVRTLGRGRWADVPGGPLRRVRIARDVLDADVVINLPKFKAHQQTLMTLSVKNLFGCVSGRRKAWLHLRSGNDPVWFARMLVQVSLAVRPALSIVDGVICMEGRGPNNGPPRHGGLLVAGTECVAIDRVCCEIAGVPWRDVPVLAAAAGMAAGETDLARIEVMGPPIAQVKIEGFVLPELEPIRFSPYRVLRGYVRNLLVQMQRNHGESG